MKIWKIIKSTTVDEFLFLYIR